MMGDLSIWKDNEQNYACNENEEPPDRAEDENEQTRDGEIDGENGNSRKSAGSGS
jgi:hypothetical protein